jgi:Ran GTPase-activating protein (RanGAP) involved in mRNA processing and transport
VSLNDVTDAGLAAVGLGLRNNQTLERFVCDSSVIGSPGCVRLCNSACTSQLRDLELNFNYIRDEGAQALAEWLTLPTCTLERVGLRDNYITGVGAEAIVEALRFVFCVFLNSVSQFDLV